MHHVGIDVHAKYSEICELNDKGRVQCRQRIPTSHAGLKTFFARHRPCRVVMESGGSTPWVRRVIQEFGHDVVVVNPRRVRLIAESTKKTDAADAEILARLSRWDPDFEHQVYQRSEGAQLLRARLRVRGSLVKSRTAQINAVRGILRAQGYLMGSSTPAGFIDRFLRTQVPSELRELLDPLLEVIAALNDQISGIEKELRTLAREDELLCRLQTIPGVGFIVCLSFVAWMDRVDRFKSSRDVGPCLGLRPRLRSSAEKTYHGSITREGDAEMRRLLVQAAHASLRCQKESALKQWAEQLAERKGKGKAMVALARKIGVLMHHLWTTGESFESFPHILNSGKAS